jgi:hypothetical protein
MTITKDYTIQVKKYSSLEMILDGTFTTVDNFITSFNVGTSNVLIPNLVGTYGNNIVSSLTYPSILIDGRTTFPLNIANQYNNMISIPDPYYFEGDKQFSFGGIALDASIPYIMSRYPQGTSPVIISAVVQSVNQEGNNTVTGSNSPDDSVMAFKVFGSETQNAEGVKIFITLQNTSGTSGTGTTGTTGTTSETNFTTDFAVLEKQYSESYSEMLDNYLTPKGYVDYKNVALTNDINSKSNNFLFEIKGITGLETIPYQYDTIKEMSDELLNLGDSGSSGSIYYNLLTTYSNGVLDRQSKTSELYASTYNETQRATSEENLIISSIQSEISSFISSLNTQKDERKAQDNSISTSISNAISSRVSTLAEEKKAREDGDLEFKNSLTTFQSTNDSKFEKIAYESNNNVYNITSNLSLAQGTSNDLSLQLSNTFRIVPSSDFKSLKFQHRNYIGHYWVDVCSLNNV